MQFFSTFTLMLLTASATAAASPRLPRVTVAVRNEFNGKVAEGTVIANGRFTRISELLKESEIDENGIILASSAELVRFKGNVFCSFHIGNVVVPLNSTSPLVDLDSNPNVALLEPLVLNDALLQCQI
jgi:hypothetical protein